MSDLQAIEKRGPLLYEWSMAEFVERYLEDERLQIAYLGQGVIGTNASPFDRRNGFHSLSSFSGRLGGMPAGWGYVKGGIGTVSFLLCDAAREAGATVATGIPVAAILPGEGVILESGETHRRPASSRTPIRESRCVAGLERRRRLEGGASNRFRSRVAP